MYDTCRTNCMNVILGLCHSYNGKVVTFQESLFACKRKLSKTSRLLLLQAATATASFVHTVCILPALLSHELQ